MHEYNWISRDYGRLNSQHNVYQCLKKVSNRLQTVYLIWIDLYWHMHANVWVHGIKLNACAYCSRRTLVKLLYRSLWTFSDWMRHLNIITPFLRDMWFGRKTTRFVFYVCALLLSLSFGRLLNAVYAFSRSFANYLHCLCVCCFVLKESDRGREKCR